MENIVYLNTNKTPITNSLKVAEAFGKEHRNVMDKIRTIQKTLESFNISLLNFKQSTYTNERGRDYPLFEMDQKAFEQLVMDFTGPEATVWKKKYIDAFHTMAEELNRSHDEFDGTKLSRRQLAQMILDAEDEIAELTPKAEAYDELMDADGSVGLQVAGKILGLRANNFIEWLRDYEGYLTKNRQGRNMPLQIYVNQGLFEIKVKPRKTFSKQHGKEITTMQKDTVITAKGLDYFRKLKAANEIPQWVIYGRGTAPEFKAV